MGRYFSLVRPGGMRDDDVAERFFEGGPAQSTGFPSAQVILNASDNGLAEEEPGLPHGSGHNAYFGKFFVGVFGTISTAHGHGEANDFAAAFKAGIRQGGSDAIRQQWICRYSDMSAGDQYAQAGDAPVQEELLHSHEIVFA